MVTFSRKYWEDKACSINENISYLQLDYQKLRQIHLEYTLKVRNITVNMENPKISQDDKKELSKDLVEIAYEKQTIESRLQEKLNQIADAEYTKNQLNQIAQQYE